MDRSSRRETPYLPARDLPLRLCPGLAYEKTGLANMTTGNFQPTRLKQIFDLELTILSPTQVGSGTKLLPDIDYFETRDGIHIVNIEGMLSDEKLAAQLFKAGGHFRLSELSRQSPALFEHVAYTTPGRANKQEIVAQVRDGMG